MTSNLISLAKARRDRAKHEAPRCDAGKLAVYIGRRAQWVLHGGRKPKPLGKVFVCPSCTTRLAACLLDDAAQCMDWWRKDEGSTPA